MKPGPLPPGSPLPSGLVRRELDLSKREELLRVREEEMERHEQQLALAERLHGLLGPWGAWIPGDALARALERILLQHRTRMTDADLEVVRRAATYPPP